MTPEQIETLAGRIGATDDLLSHELNERVLHALGQLAHLARRYHVVVANPPYMGDVGMNDALRAFLKDAYCDGRSDLFAAFVLRILQLVQPAGFTGQMTPFTWMFLNSYQDLRMRILGSCTLTSLVRPEYHAFFDSAFVPICCFTMFAKPLREYRGTFVDLNEFYGAEQQPQRLMEAIRKPDCGWLFRASSADFEKVPGIPVAYWLSDALKNVFQTAVPLGKTHFPRKGLTTGKNDVFLRLWFEIETTKFSVFGAPKWFPMTKGGEFRKWYGNNEYVVDWENDGERLKAFSGSVVRNERYYLREGGSWNGVSMAPFALRYMPIGFINNAAGPMIYSSDLPQILALLNSVIAKKIFKLLSPTMNVEIGSVASFPCLNDPKFDQTRTDRLVWLSTTDWDSYETSWDFADLPLLRADFRHDTLADTYAALRGHWRGVTLEMQRLEEKNNRIFIEAYGLGDELTPDVPLAEITLTCNPHYRYGGQGSGVRDQGSVIRTRWPEVCAGWSAGEEGLELRLLADTMREFISYAVGCMFGRYSLEKPGLILANQGETVEDYERIVGDPSTAPLRGSATKKLSVRVQGRATGTRSATCRV